MPLTSAHIKWIACIIMLMDHTASVLLPQCRILKLIGRMAFPLFVFLLVEGFAYTKSRSRYAWRLLVFAVISEVPFDLALRLSPGDIQSGIYTTFLKQNVMWTLLFGFLYMWAAETAYETYGKRMRHESQNASDVPASHLLVPILMTSPVLAALILLAEWMRTDYHGYGVAAIAACYLIKKWGFPVWLMPVGATAVFMANPRWHTEGFAVLAAFLLYFYNGQKGKNLSKYFFYAFYPAHLLVLAVISYWLAVR